MIARVSAVHLHVHSEYSLLDGACKLVNRSSDGTDRGLAARAAELGMPALGLTDHGVMNGAVEHYKACREHQIKPILGLEAYLVDDVKAAAESRVRSNHLTLIAASDAGFRNLVKLTSAGFLEGFSRGKPNLDLELLDRHAEGVIALTGCLQSRFCRPWSRIGPRTLARTSTSCRRLRGRPALLRGAGERDRRAGEGERGDRAIRARAQIARWSRPPTSTTSGARTTPTTRRCSACRRSRRSSSRS